METIKIKYFDNEIDKIEKISKGDLIDLRAAETVEMKKGDFRLISLGVGMKLPDGYKANVYPRSSTYKNFGIILANSVGQIDKIRISPQEFRNSQNSGKHIPPGIPHNPHSIISHNSDFQLCIFKNT